ncbi:MAG TPA: DUF2071 domain-containing protein [Patescibacteria group bacterium]|nr:DUF2071 domain-containing protein [Patescibacteria group bacterium]
MLPTLEGIIARRVLVNFRVDPDVARRLVPSPLEPVIERGACVAGICLIRLERLRPRGFPAAVGLASENMAHRIAIRYPTPEGPSDGVFIWRRDTEQALVSLLGGRLFPGVHGKAAFDVTESDASLRMDVSTERGEADVALRVRSSTDWRPTPLFPTFDAVCEFFRRGDCGFSCSLHQDRLEGMRLKTLVWKMEPLAVDAVRAAFYADVTRFPSGAAVLDGAVLMRGIPHEWHELTDVPELATTA